MDILGADLAVVTLSYIGISLVCMVAATLVSTLLIRTCRNTCPEMEHVVYHGTLHGSHVFVEWNRVQQTLQTFSCGIDEDPSKSFKNTVITPDLSKIYSGEAFEGLENTVKPQRFDLLDPKHQLVGYGGGRSTGENKHFLHCRNLVVTMLDSSGNFSDHATSMIIPNRHNLANIVLFIDFPLTGVDANSTYVQEVPLSQISLNTFSRLVFFYKQKN